MDQKKHTILVVEDEKTLVQAIEKKLKSEGFETLVAMDGLSALEMARSNHPDLILLDIILPQLDGLSVLEQLRQDDWGKEVPVIMLTNLAQADAEEVSKERGARAFLVKTDWKLEDVARKIKEVLGIDSM